MGFLSNKCRRFSPRKRRRRLEAWEVREMLEKGVQKMRKDGIPILREVENEINARVLDEEPKPLPLSKELIKKELWEVEPYSDDWFRIINYRVQTSKSGSKKK